MVTDMRGSLTWTVGITAVGTHSFSETAKETINPCYVLHSCCVPGISTGAHLTEKSRQVPPSAQWPGDSRGAEGKRHSASRA